MSNVIEFESRTTRLFERKQARFEELKPKNFSETLTTSEEIEFDNLYNWLQIHKTKVIH